MGHGTSPLDRDFRRRQITSFFSFYFYRIMLHLFLTGCDCVFSKPSIPITPAFSNALASDSDVRDRKLKIGRLWAMETVRSLAVQNRTFDAIVLG